MQNSLFNGMGMFTTLIYFLTWWYVLVRHFMSVAYWHVKTVDRNSPSSRCILSDHIYGRRLHGAKILEFHPVRRDDHSARPRNLPSDASSVPDCTPTSSYASPNWIRSLYNLLWLSSHQYVILLTHKVSDPWMNYLTTLYEYFKLFWHSRSGTEIPDAKCIRCNLELFFGREQVRR
jgi:hypothetical protein